MNDLNKKEIKVGDLVLYSHGFYAPVVGAVVKLYKNSFRFEYCRTDYKGETQVIDSVCKIPSASVIVTPLKDNKSFLDIFNIVPILHNVRGEDDC